MNFNRVWNHVPKRRKKSTGERIGSLWLCGRCGAQLITTPGGPAPSCGECDNQKETIYKGGVRLVLPDGRWVGDNRGKVKLENRAYYEDQE